MKNAKKIPMKNAKYSKRDNTEVMIYDDQE